MGRDRRKRAGRRAGPFRTCLGCRKRRPLKETLRVVCGPQGQILPDLYSRLPGRGAHLCPDAACFDSALDRKAFGRAFKAEVRAVDVAELIQAFARSGLGQLEALLATAARSGWLAAGRAQVIEALAARRAALVVLADDASASLGREFAGRTERAQVPCRRVLSKQVLARFHKAKPLAVAGVTHRGLAARIMEEIDRTCELLDSVRNRGDPFFGELTAGTVRGMMPQAAAGPARERV